LLVLQPRTKERKARKTEMPFDEDDYDVEEKHVNAGFDTSVSWKADMRLAAHYTVTDIRKRPRNFVIGIVSTIVVVFVIGLVLLGISKGPVVFVRFVELTVGETDSLILAEGELPFVNYTDLGPKIAKSQRTSGSVPRWLLKGEMSALPANQGGPHAGNPNNNSVTTNVLIVDSKREKEVGVGRAWPYRTIGWGEVQELQSVLDFIGVPPNEGLRASIFMDIAGVLQQQNAVPQAPGVTVPAGINQSLVIPFLNLTIGDVIPSTQVGQQDVLEAALTPTLKLSVADGVTDIAGKFPSTLGNTAVMDYHTLIPLLLTQMCYDTIRSPFNTFLGSGGPTTGLPPQEDIEGLFNLNDYALLVVAQLRDKFTTYYKLTRDRDVDMIGWSNDLFMAVGIDFQGNVQYPVAVALAGFDSFILFLNSIFQAVNGVLVVLGTILTYTLLVTNSEERSYDVAIMRSQGMSKRQLLVLMTFQMAIFVLPGTFIAMGLLLSANAGLEYALATFTFAPPRPGTLDWLPVVVPLIVGLVIPVFANIGPIKSATSTSLRDALDVYRNKDTETTVVITKLEELGIEPWQAALGSLLVAAGFMVYYLVPFSFLFNELWIFFLIFNIILMGMLLGLCLMTHALQGPIEKVVLFFTIWGKEKRLQMLVEKNLKAHRDRNSKGFIMFTMAVAAVVFGGVLFSTLASSIVQTIENALGADVVVQTLAFDTPINRTLIEQIVASSIGVKTIASWSMVTFALSAYPQVAGGSKVMNLIGFPSSRQAFVAVDENYLDTVFPQYVIVEGREDIAYAKSSTGVIDVVRSLYSSPANDRLKPAGKIYTGFPKNITEPDIEVKYDLVIPSITASSATANVGTRAGSFTAATWKYVIGEIPNARAVTTVFLLRCRALVKKLPGFAAISSLRFAYRASTTIIPVPLFAELVKANEIDFPTASATSERYRYQKNAVKEVRYEKVLLRLNGGLSAQERERAVNVIRSKMNPYYHFTVDTKAVVDSVKLVGDLIIYFFYFSAAIAILLDTFMLVLVFVSNVQLNSWSFAVLRSLGFTSSQLFHAYTYESLALVLGSMVAGIVIGVIIAITMVLQINLFLQMPLTFDFPWVLFMIILVLSFVSAVLAPRLATASIAKRGIAAVIKSG
jgi:ABC-type antimicrobial peptide transport system permease subunit